MKTEDKYKDLDGAVLKSLSGTPLLFTPLVAQCATVSRLLSQLPGETAEPWRIVDRRLQALRKSDLIRYRRKPAGWVLVAKAGGAA